MNKISIQAAEAFGNKVRFSGRNTRVAGQVMYLFEKRIAWWEREGVVLTMAGEDTNTTTERLKAVLSYLGTGLSLHRRRGISYLVDSEGVEIMPMPLKRTCLVLSRGEGGLWRFRVERMQLEYDGRIWTLAVDAA